MAQFQDLNGFVWSVDIKVRDVERVRNHVTGVNGKPLDLLELAENGNFSGVNGSVQTIINVVFWLCFDEIMTNFDLEQWDKDHQSLYKYLPDEKAKTPIQKAADWFGSRIGGEQVLPLVKAWEEALLNFIPNPRVKAAIQKVMEREEVFREKVIETAEKNVLHDLDQNQVRLGELSANSQENSA